VGTSTTPPGAAVVSTPENTATGSVACTSVPLRSATVLGSSWKVASSVSRLSTSNGPMVTLISPPGRVAATGGLPLMRQLGFTVTTVFGLTPTTVTYDRSTMRPMPGKLKGTGCPAGHPITR
jgi:hypothetical protein